MHNWFIFRWNYYIILDGSEWDTRNIPRVRANIARIEDECNIGPNEWNILVSHEVKPSNIIIIIVNDHIQMA